MRKLWGGAFAAKSDQLVDRFGQSIDSDLRFWREDVEGSIAHAAMLGDCGIISRAEAEALVRGLSQILAEGPDSLPKDVEDIHTAVEARLFELVGDPAKKLHTARSRNDQVATDARLWLRREAGATLDGIKATQNKLVSLGSKYSRTIMPGYTHQQQAQPITLGYHLMAHFWALQRDGWRFERMAELANYSPLGAGALAGTTFPIDRIQTARSLGFTAPIPNALDATSERSFVLDALNACAHTMINLSRISQELVVWSGTEYGFVRLSDSVTTGSSIMPQKRNPDMAELIRGRTGRAIGNWTAFASTMKGLMLGYNRDLQDDKPLLFESFDLVRDSLALVDLMLGTAKWNVRRMRNAMAPVSIMATDLADHLTAKGMPFREAHEKVGETVRTYEIDKVEPVLDGFNMTPTVAGRNSLGAPGPYAMREQIRHARRLHRRPGFKTPY